MASGGILCVFLPLAPVYQEVPDGYIQHNLAYGTGAGEQVAFDIFRFDENGKIAEHWDVMETIADQSTWQNQNGKF